MRNLAREICFKAMFSKQFALNENVLVDLYEEFGLTDKADIAFCEQLYTLWENNSVEIDSMISENLKGYAIDRVYKVDLVLLELAITEIYYYKETPLAVVINEIVSMAKKYSTEKSYSFINGFLKGINKDK